MPDGPAASLLLRVLTPAFKALTAKAAIAGLAECMESLGGVGYLDSSSPLDIGTNIGRLYRDASVLSIWEGTTDVMADDTIRVLKGKGGAEVIATLEIWVSAALGTWKDPQKRVSKECFDAVEDFWRKFIADIKAKETNELALRGRKIMEDLGWIFSANLLIEDAASDNDEVACEVARRWVSTKTKSTEEIKWQKLVEWDRRIVFGGHERKTLVNAKL